MIHQQHQFNMDYIIFWSSIITFLVLSHKANGILTDLNDLQCTHVQCPTKCPEDSYLKSTLDAEEQDDFEDYEDGFISSFEELPLVLDAHDEHPEHTVKERQKREVFFQEDIEKCCDNQKCVCNKCQDLPKCFEGYVAIEVHEGQGVPGNCCSVYKCNKKEKCKVGNKQTWWTSKCTKCSCFGENELCMQICPEEEIVQNCYSEYWQKPMLNGASWKEGPCTSCTCEQGERRCLTPVCPKLDCKHIITYEDECCPKCIDDEADERMEIVHIKNMQDEDEEEVSENYTTETLGISENSELNSTEVMGSITTEIVDLSNNLINSVGAEISENTTASIITTTGEISATPATIEFETTKLSVETTTNAANSSTSTSTPLAEVVSQSTNTESSTIFSTTLSDEIKLENDSTIQYSQEFSLDFSTPSIFTTTTTEETNSEQTRQDKTYAYINSTTEDIAVSNSMSTPNKDTTTQSSLETITSTEKIYTTTSIVSLGTSTDITSLNNVTANSRSSSSSSFNTTVNSITLIPVETTISASTAVLTNTVSAEISTLKTISSSDMSTSTTETSKDSSINDSSTSTFTTSTTSSPFAFTWETSSVTPNKKQMEETSTTSTTTAPEVIKPLYELYGDFNKDEHVNSSTQNQMRIIFDEIDYVVMTALFIGSLTCIALGFIIRHAKNRKKMYSSIPNSETSLSQTSTVLTV